MHGVLPPVRFLIVLLLLALLLFERSLWLRLSCDDDTTDAGCDGDLTWCRACGAPLASRLD